MLTSYTGRAFFKDLRKVGRTVKDDWPRYHEYARTRGSIYGGVTGVKRGDEGAERWEGDSPLRSASGHGGADSSTSNEKYGSHGKEGTFDTNDHGADTERLSADYDVARYGGIRTPSPANGPNSSAYPISPTLQALYPHDDSPRPASRAKRGSITPAQPYIPRDAAINRTDLIASAERIYSRYLMPGADKEVYLPAHLQIHDFPISSSTLPSISHPSYDAEADAQARVPDMFHAQKEYVYRAMEMDTFPRFLRAKAFGNLTPVSALVRLGVGLMALWAGLATAFAFIFLDTTPRVMRLWVRPKELVHHRSAANEHSQIILPFTVAILNILAHSYDLDPIMVFMGVSETVRSVSAYYSSVADPVLADSVQDNRHPRAVRSQASLRTRSLDLVPHRRHRRHPHCHLLGRPGAPSVIVLNISSCQRQCLDSPFLPSFVTPAFLFFLWSSMTVTSGIAL